MIAGKTNLDIKLIAESNESQSEEKHNNGNYKCHKIIPLSIGVIYDVKL
jgi:hypothetical protein